ncbi:MAG: putative quinol monooxygenase [Paracoccaceae bacterium]
MSLLVYYTLKNAEDHDAQVAAMEALVAACKAEGIAGSDGLQYSCYGTEDPTRFVGVLEFDGDEGRAAFINSAAFAAYRETVGDILAGPPDTTPITAIASTRT